MPNLLFCMTPGVGLNTWKKIGCLGRELKPYMEYVRRGWNVKMLTFDKEALPELPDGIEPVRFPNRLLLWMLPWTHRKLGEWVDVIKTNQSHHAYFYTRAAGYWKKPILVRSGYVHGEYLETTLGLTARTRFYQWLEAKAFQSASHCQVTSEALSQWVAEKYNIRDEKISIVPNFVDTDIFKPMQIEKKKRSVVSVGRLSPVKRFDLLIEACSAISGCELTIIGEGPERCNLEQMAKELGLKLTLPGNIPNESIPEVLLQHAVFAITSEREGHPKALIEAMACGIPVLGVRAIGIQNIIAHKKNGWLVEPDREHIIKGLSALFENPELSKELSINAREHVLWHYNFNACFSTEYNNMEAIINGAVTAGSDPVGRS